MQRKLIRLTTLLTLTLVAAACSSTQTGSAPTTADEAPTPAATTQPRTTPSISAEKKAALLIDYLADNSRHLSRLTPGYIYERLHHREDSAAICDAFDRLLVAVVPDAHQHLIDELELDFIHDPDTSSLDLLNYELKVHFSTFPWEANDYPGGPEGANEQLADIMVDALDIVRPERRANRSRTAVIRRDVVTDEIWAYMLAQWTPVPGEPDWKLNRHAVDAYVRMREAAAADGVTLKIRSGHRDPAKAKRNAARRGNHFATASFSAHSLGLAIDFALPDPKSDRVFDITTSPMPYVVAMRYSPVHKWMHLRGERFGWYPFQHEPWHWEFNPPGFREVFFADYPGGAPDMEPVFE
ncbi:M15 family metallopeptidase [Mucisphaera calidilacus]|uniref:D-alanyl-D-alanine carboxypeptidase n=1 Tax=Mucisphaera calidilacus TaxID=2527982 RepID=A0A518BWV3_9BACT|nr:M15 family metallopeptidase [Mucisphaera calidilacus]QDU71459.1 D-alanyl-D-alanine carboxypeptidase [Mucisphaera calidilacus]